MAIPRRLSAIMINLFRKKYSLIINIPDNISIEYQDNRAKIIGDKNALYNFIPELIKISKLKAGALCKLDKLTLKVSDFVTLDSEKPFWIEMPDHTWGIMACKFYDVWEGYGVNLFYFNECGYLTPKNKYDLGIEIIDMPIKYEELVDGALIVRIIQR